MNGTNNAAPNSTSRIAKPAPTGPAPPAPPAVPPAPPNNAQVPPNNKAPAHNNANTVNGTHATSQKGKKKTDPPVDPAAMYESLKNRIAALEEEEVLEEEEERRFAEEAIKSVKGMGENAIHAKYIELFAELKRLERDHAKEKQKLVKDKDAAKGQLTKANQTKAKMENLARELQKDNKRLREDSKRLAQCVEEAQDEIVQMKNDISRRADKAKLQDMKYRDMPDIVVKVICRYRAELFFKISRKTKLSRLFNAWTDRMETSGGAKGDTKGTSPAMVSQTNGAVKSEAASTHSIGSSSSSSSSSTMQFIFTHNGRTVDADQTPEEAGMEDGDEILAVEIMDLTEATEAEEGDEQSEPRRHRLKKNWTDNPNDARRTLEDIFDSVVRERLKEVLRLYELRERHFECVIRSKELEVLLSRARAAEQRQSSDGEILLADKAEQKPPSDEEKVRADKAEEENRQLRKELEETRRGQSMLINKLVIGYKEPGAQRVFASLREELEKGVELADAPQGG